MQLEQKHINLFEKLLKLYVSESDSQYFEDKHQLSVEIAQELSYCAAALRLLSDFNTKIDCQGIGFSKVSDFQKIFHTWLKSKSWKGLSHISNLSALIRKQKEFESLQISNRDVSLDLLIN